MTMPGQQELDLIQRTMENLEFIERHKREEGVWEVTQTINSFLSVIAHPWERLLDKGKLNRLLLTDARAVAWSLPPCELSWEYDWVRPRTVGGLLRNLRNGIAHGNIRLMELREVLDHRPDAAKPTDISLWEIGGIEIWNELDDKRNWGTILSIEEMRSCLLAVHCIAGDPDLRAGRSRSKPGGRYIDA